MKIKAILIFVFFSYLSFGQSPQKFTYQSIIKNSSGYLLKNQDVGLRISVLSNSSNGIEVYSEEHFPTSNSNGLVTLIIGEGLTNDNFSEIQWGDGEFFLKVEVDPEGGNNYTMNQTSQLLSVPYALYAGNSGSKLNLLGQDFITLQDQTLTVNKVDLADDVNGVLPIGNGGTGSSTAPMVGVITAVDSPAARQVLGLGTAATENATAFATAAQGALADTALQDATAFATAAQGALADTALQDATAFATAAQGALADTALQDATAFATAAQGALADTSLQDATAFATAVQGALADTSLQDATAFATAAQGALADTSLQASNNLSDITNVVAARTALGIDVSGTDNSTNVSLAGSLDYLTLSGQAITLGQVDYDTDISNKPTLLQLGSTSSTALAGNTNTITSSQASAISANTSKITDSGTPALISDGSDPSLNTGITAAEVRSLIGVDASSTDNSTNVSLAGSLDYLTLSGQAITLGQVDYDTDISNKPTLLQLGSTSSTALAGNTNTITSSQASAISANTSKITDSGTPALISDGSDPSLNTGITAAEVRSLIGVDASSTDNSTNVSLAGSLDYLTLSGQAITLGSITNDDLAGSIADSKLNQITSSNKVQTSALDIDGANDIGAAIVDSDLIIIDDGAAGTNRKAAVSRLKTYIQGASSLNSLTDVLVEDESYYLGNEPSNTSTAEKNIAIGLTALDAITTGDYNVAVGSDALTNNSSGNNNIAIGRFTMEDNISGYQNTAFGNVALQSSTSSGNNVAIGHSSLTNVTEGEKNIGISSSAPSLTTGDKNVVIGYVADVSSNNAQNQIVIGEQASGQGDNYAVIGNEDITRLYAAEDAGAVLFAGGINLSGGTSISAFKFGTLTMGSNVSEAFSVSGVNASSIVTASFKSGDNGRYIKTVTPSSNTITITLDGAASGGVIMYIIIN
jgi:hypothetical protein